MAPSAPPCAAPRRARPLLAGLAVALALVGLAPGAWAHGRDGHGRDAVDAGSFWVYQSNGTHSSYTNGTFGTLGNATVEGVYDALGEQVAFIAEEALELVEGGSGALAEWLDSFLAPSGSGFRGRGRRSRGDDDDDDGDDDDDDDCGHRGHRDGKKEKDGNRRGGDKEDGRGDRRREPRPAPGNATDAPAEATGEVAVRAVSP